MIIIEIESDADEETYYQAAADFLMDPEQHNYVIRYEDDSRRRTG